ncbi:MAG: hypothetical protein AAB395_02660, partial [Patescibacteria group bacterium]
MMQKKKANKIWISASISSVIIVSITHLYVQSVIQDKPLGSSANGNYDQEWFYVIWLGLIALPLLAVLTYKVKGWYKVIPVVCGLIIIALIASATFSYSLGAL